MTAAPNGHHRQLPPEFDSPLDAVLDMIEASVTTAIDLGLEPQLRARLARMLPAPVPARPAPVPVSMPAAARSCPLDLATVLTVCRDLEQFKLSGPKHAAIARLKAWLVAELAAANVATATATASTAPAPKEPA